MCDIFMDATGGSNKFPFWNEVHRLGVNQDSDNAQDRDSKSVSHEVTMLDTRCLFAPVATQTAPALSSSEAEFVPQVKRASIENGMQSMAQDMVTKRLDLAPHKLQ